MKEIKLTNCEQVTLVSDDRYELAMRISGEFAALNFPLLAAPETEKR